MRERMMRYLRYLLPMKWWFLLAILSGVIAAGASGMGIPFMIYKVFPVVFDPSKMPEAVSEFMAARVDPANLKNVLLLLACAVMPVVFVIRGVAMWLNAVLVSYVGMKILEHIRMDVFRKLQSLPLSFLERQQKGDLISRVITDTQNVQTMITQVSNDIIKQPLTAVSAIGVLIYMMYEQGTMGMMLTNIGFAALALAPIIICGKRIANRSRKAQKGLGDITSVVQESLASQREIRSYGLEQRQIDELSKGTDKYCKDQLKAVKYQQILVPVMETVTALALANMLVQGRAMGMTLTDFLGIAGALFFAFDSMKRAGIAFNKLNQAQASLERLDAILSEPDTMPDPELPQPIGRVEGRISFRNVNFSYEEGKPILKNIQVEIPAGQVVALVGPSGAGKTTFASLIPRFYDATSGAVLIDGVDVKDVAKTELRRHLALVSQHAMLFRQSIKENIRIGRSQAEDEEVLQAAREASVFSFLDDQPQGIDTVLGDAGGGLSGGQRQRVAIARAFLKDAPILILDEATAALDAESEEKIQHELEHLVKGRTTLIVAHRFSSIRVADRILVFSHGEIVGDGTHSELYSSCPLYRELYDKQGI